MQLNEFYTADLEEGVNDPGIFKAIFMAGPPGNATDPKDKHRPVDPRYFARAY